MLNTFSFIEDKIYQLFIVRLDGDKLADNSYRDKIISLVKRKVGGFLLFGGQKYEIKAFIEELQMMAHIPLFIASDIERGVGQQVRGMTEFPCSMAIASAINLNKRTDLSLLRRALIAISKEAIFVGINMPLIPVLDINENPNNPIICTRAFSDIKEKVKKLGAFFINIIQQEGLICCAKHFPGHGDTDVDSHISLPVIQKSLGKMLTHEIEPFKIAIEHEVGAIMVGHLSIPAVDPMPASISRKIITNLLRKRLKFKGLIMTDALNMDSLKSFKNLYTSCLEAGVNILLHPMDLSLAIEEIRDSLKEGVLKESLIDRSLSLILEAKKKIPFKTKKIVNLKGNIKTANKILERSITLIKHTEGLLPIVEKEQVTLLFAGDRSFYENSPLRQWLKNSYHVFDNYLNSMDIMIFAIFTNVLGWKGTSGIDIEEIKRINEISKNSKKTIIISFGCPYVLRYFRDAHVLIAVYGTGINYQQALIKLIDIGPGSFKGKLPIKPL
ncbi:MAG: hypothetical protein N3A59_04325 [Thermodesulfovibrionales bacterium]|nr:hypothetical protein [Thermodesulfovibrionales bacterium]